MAIQPTSDARPAQAIRSAIPSQAASPSDPPAGAVWNREACEAFVEVEYRRVYGWFCWHTGRSDRAADLTQETFAEFWQSLLRRRVRAPGAWLMRIARNRWRKDCRDRRAHAAIELQSSLTASGEGGSAGDEIEAIRAAVAELPAKYREAIVLRFWCEHSFAEIGRVVGVPALLARWRVHRGRSLLRQRLGSLDDRSEVFDG